MPRLPILLLAVLLPLAGCDQLGLEAASVTAARVEADGKAVGAACRHGGRAIEDCFTLNRKVDKAAIYAGWREMDDYMRENKLEPVAPSLGPDARPKTAVAAESADAASAIAKVDKPADKAAEKSAKADKGGPAKADKAEKLAKAEKQASPVAEKPPAEH